MIKIICNCTDKEINRIEILGHAGTNKKGHDLVCAAVSGIVVGAINALEGFSKKEIKSSDGHIIINVNRPISKEDDIRLNMMIKQLEVIANNNPKNVKIIKEKSL